ncbi:hypothetical protein OSB04_018433 [Centaurea solstitialis]|uniref:AAA+ ATPase domain-containing protein n=1 Tax=Centaurea solstitialis TaxID=347529 RepID=A0AA38TCD4_9ASTR|nr:hypothetical protein OSB04_018433 [Centaurea solstitialis]
MEEVVQLLFLANPNESGGSVVANLRDVRHWNQAFRIWCFFSLHMISLPGTGKTFMTEAVAGEASSDVSFLFDYASEYVDVGIGPTGIEDLFSEAREKQPSIVFIDRIDTIGRSCGTQLLHPALKQNNDDRSGILVIVATNQPESLHEKLIGDNKHLKKIWIHKPDKDGREEIFSSLMREMIIEEKDSICASVASLTKGFARGDLKSLSVDARRIAARRGLFMPVIRTGPMNRSSIPAGPNPTSSYSPAQTDKNDTSLEDSPTTAFAMNVSGSPISRKNPGNSIPCFTYASFLLSINNAYTLKARENEPSVVFIDQIEAIGQPCGTTSTNQLYPALNQYQRQENPYKDGRQEIFASLMKYVVMEDKEDICALVASLIEGFVGENFKRVSGDARGFAARSGHVHVTRDDVRDAVEYGDYVEPIFMGQSYC